MPENNRRTVFGNAVRYLGWAIVAINGVYMAYGFVTIYSDVSVRAFAPLVLMEGAMYVAVGLLIVGVGRLIRGKPRAVPAA
ncbi:protein of unknown function [Magnetospirillum sp. XM-1]|uniref:hypothetical protein n=1 Tax=Magnetospirillum sp. XM-1 TaxID=1663591 RepID=UPI00073DE5EA|nr:hypothetical protein [Magnetospirillum sp. XM-1]CUW41686.1 protein of unknown function [Magnetospirillum sp. XM-1]